MNVVRCSRARRRKDSKTYRSSRVGLGFVEGDASRDEDLNGRTTRTKAAPELTMSECRGHNCIYQKLNNIHVVESSRIPSHLSTPCGTLRKQSHGVELEESVDDETAIRGLRCVINVPEDVLLRDLTKI